MEEQGYTEESYEAWKEHLANDMGIRDIDAESIEALVEKKMLLGILEEGIRSDPTDLPFEVPAGYL